MTIQQEQVEADNGQVEADNGQVEADNGQVDNELAWGDTAPKGGKTVVNRVLKDGAKVPLFLGQTLIRSLRDLGYNNTTTAVCEHVDNAIQWGATEVRVYFNQTGRRGDYNIGVLVLDNGQGMAPHVLQMATAFGGSMVYDNRDGIGRYGMGMKTAALSMSPVLEIYSWQEPGAIYNMTLDTDDIGRDRRNLIELSDPELNDVLPSELADILIGPMVFPKNPDESQTLFATNQKELRECLGNSGTIVFMPNCDRVTYRTAKTLVEHAVKEMGRIYRRQIEKGLRLYVNNRLVEAFDPTYWMTSARHASVEGIEEKQSRLVKSWPVEIPVCEHSSQTATATIRLYVLPFDDWSKLPRKVLKNDLHVFDDHTVSFLRNDREVEIGRSYQKLGISRHADNNWVRVQIDFGGNLDEAFGIAANKQGVRPKGYVSEIIRLTIADELSGLRDRLKKMKADRASRSTGSNVSEAEKRATEADSLQGKQLPGPETEEEKAAVDTNLRTLAIGLKREDETDEDAFERIKASTYITVLKYDPYWPFYHCDFQFGKVILTINTAHPFFTKVWEPLSAIAKAVDIANDGNSQAEDVTVDDRCSEVLIGMQLMLLSLARTQSQMSGADQDDEHRQLFEKLRTEWSANLKTQLNAS